MEHFVGLALSGLTRIYLLVSYQLCKQKHVQSQQQSQLIVCTLFKVNIMTREQQWWRCLYVFIFNFEHTLQASLLSLLLALNLFVCAKTFFRIPRQRTTKSHCYSPLSEILCSARLLFTACLIGTFWLSLLHSSPHFISMLL